MRRLLALIFAICIWANFAPSASADEVAGLVPCSESPAFQQRAENARNTNFDPDSGRKRFERYAQAYCGPEGLPHLIVDGRLNRAGDFIIPGILFLYIAGWIGWVGRSYIQSVKKEASPEMREIIIDVPRAVSLMLSGFTWPLAAVNELLTGKLTAKEDEIPVSIR
ncbi:MULTISPECIES: Photosystem I reaction center subunit III [Cyanophyceae]|uniref:Photosystem I reaction center subunit III n=1 Tax=Cyanophyceae TaxID=3028117 RepID=UPI001683D45C|nr:MULTISPECIES: Photosystem I reaction center subunit III [unclassified Trichocoleus]MBD1935037.1 Photosystem I reaction center subunit III [Trichocoleus sp. FACHB-69]MBD2003096.1 Photosystem I reaction center subunit III [Trichocoleus sp. FACHB-40]